MSGSFYSKQMSAFQPNLLQNRSGKSTMMFPTGIPTNYLQAAKRLTQVELPDGNHPILIGFATLLSIFISMYSLIIMKEFQGCAICSSISENMEAQKILNRLFWMIFIGLMFGIILLLFCFWIYKQIMNRQTPPIKITSGFFIFYSLGMLIIESIVLGTVRHDKKLDTIRSQLVSYSSFSLWCGIGILIRALCIIIFTGLLIQWSVKAGVKMASQIAPLVSMTAGGIAK